MWSGVDAGVALIAPVLALWILVSGLDDLVVLGAFLWMRWRVWRGDPAEEECSADSPLEPPIAVFVPCWQESGVIEEMVAHNVSAIRYRDYHMFVGAYPNDEPTMEAVRRLEGQYANVHLCPCPYDGPTSKADCLNWTYQQMLLFEESAGARFELVVIHDAEDVVHRDELRLMARHARDCDMVQVPVLPLETPLTDWTHGLYCDDFAEGHTKDLMARQALGGFIPSCGVGTAYRREVLERLAESESNRIFEPGCLTEDYENGLRLRLMGSRQVFVPVRFAGGTLVATREFFPRRFGDAVRQRTRWVTGIALQTWERHGWRGGWRQRYWLWRDRKGLISSPVSLAANAIFLYGLASWAAARVAGTDWALGARLDAPWLAAALGATAVLQVIHLGVRMWLVGGVYGLRFALGVAPRVVYGNLLNTVAVSRAVATYARARCRHEPLVWVKTEHAYPSRVALQPHKRPLEEILVGSLYLTPLALERARATKPRGVRLAEHLVHQGLLTEDELYEALSLQLGLALEKISPGEVQRNVARSLPAAVIREWNVLPVRIEAGNLHLASPNPPSDELQEALRRFTRLGIRVGLVTRTNFNQLAQELL